MFITARQILWKLINLFVFSSFFLVPRMDVFMCGMPNLATKCVFWMEDMLVLSNVYNLIRALWWWLLPVRIWICGYQISIKGQIQWYHKYLSDFCVTCATVLCKYLFYAKVPRYFDICIHKAYIDFCKFMVECFPPMNKLIGIYAPK